MLVLTRKDREAIVVGSGNIEQQLKITVLEIRGHRVRLGFEAPGHVPIHRLEVWERIRADGIACGAGSGR